MGVWRRHGEAASAAALYSVYHGLYTEAVVSSAVALAEVGHFREAVQYVQRVAKALYEAAKEVFERVKVTVQRLVELLVEAVARVLAWVDKHRAYLFLMAAVAAGAVALSVALNLWDLVELEKLTYAASLTPFIPAGVREHPREEVFKVLREAPDPYERFKDIAKAAITKNEKLAEPWESLRVLIMPKRSEEKRLMMGKAYGKLDERKKKALFYAALALEEAFGIYRSALKDVAGEREKAVEKREMGEGPFKKAVYMLDVGRLTQLAEEESKAFKDALRALRERLNEYAVKHSLRDLLDVNESKARELSNAERKELSEFNDVNFGVKSPAALIAYREYALGRRGAFGAAAGYWLEVGGSAWLLYYAPKTAYDRAKKAKAERPAAVEELVAEAFRRLFLKPGADRHSRFVEELTKGGRLALMFDRETESAYVFKLYNMKEGGGLVYLGISLWIAKVGEGEKAGITYTLIFDVERWRGFFKPELKTAEKAAEVVRGRLPVEDLLLYMLGWVASDVAISRNKKGERVLQMSTSHLWQLAETHALFGWSVVGLRMSLTLEGPKLQVMVEAPLDRLDEAIRRSAGGGWLKMLGVEAESWENLKQRIVENWDVVVDAAVRRLSEGVRGELEALSNKLNNDKIAREVVAPALLLIQAEKLGVNDETLEYFAAVISSTIGGDGYVSAARREVGLSSGEPAVAVLWAAVLAAYSVKTKVEKVGSAFRVVASDDDAIKLVGLYFRYGSPLLEEDERIINHKLAEAVKLGAEGLNIRWEGLRRRTEKGYVAADLIISEEDVEIRYNVYLWEKISLEFLSTDRSRAELAARLLRLAGVGAEVKKKEDGKRDVWRVEVSTDVLAAGREELREAITEIVRKAVENGWVDAGTAERWLEKLVSGRVLMEGWPEYYVGLVRSGALMVRYHSTDPDSIARETQRFREMGLEGGVHFTVKMPEGGKAGYVRILREGLERASWLSVHGEGERQELAAKFVNYILRRAWEAGEEVYEKAKMIVEEGKARGSLRLEGFEGRVEVGGKTHVVKVVGWSAKLEKSQSGKKLLRIRITAEVDDVQRNYEITYGRYGKDNAAVGYAYARSDAPGGKEADAERFAALVKALTGKEPRIIERSNGTIRMECYREHLDGFMRYAELADAIEKWLEETKL